MWFLLKYGSETEMNDCSARVFLDLVGLAMDPVMRVAATSMDATSTDEIAITAAADGTTATVVTRIEETATAAITTDFGTR
jgi:hypothetical protein